MFKLSAMQQHVGTVTPLSRKREIYSICQEYNIIILEDDAYYYLQYPDLQGRTGRLLCFVSCGPHNSFFADEKAFGSMMNSSMRVIANDQAPVFVYAAQLLNKQLQ